MTRLERAGLLAALLLAAVLVLPLRGYLTDDTFIHLQYARHLADGHGPVFNVGERVYGCTSPLWMLLLALAMTLGADGLAAAKALGAASTLASVVLLFVLARRTLRAPALRVAAVVTWAAHAWMIRWALSGMETPLAAALTLAGFVALTSARRAGARSAGAGLAWALAALVRPEASLLLLAWSASTLAGGVESPAVWRRARALAPAVIVAGAWLLFARSYYGSFVPHTLSAKAAGSTGLAAIPDNARRMAEIVGAADGVLVVLLVAALAASARARAGALAGPRLLAWAWTLGVPALYLARGVPVISRYLVPVSPVLAWLAWLAADAWWLDRGAAASSGRAARLAALVTACALAQNLVAWRLVVQPQVTSFTRGMEQGLIPLGRWLDAHAPANAAVATPDIGAIGYYGRRRVIDLGGLVTPRMVPLLERAPFEDVLARFAFADFARPEFVLDRAQAAGDLQRRSPYGAALAPVDTASVPNLGVAHPGRVVYTLYRVDWTRMDAARKSG